MSTVTMGTQLGLRGKDWSPWEQPGMRGCKKRKKRKTLYGWKGPRIILPSGPSWITLSLIICARSWRHRDGRSQGLTPSQRSGHCEPLEMQPRVAGSGLMVSKGLGSAVGGTCCSGWLLPEFWVCSLCAAWSRVWLGEGGSGPDRCLR